MIVSEKIKEIRRQIYTLEKEIDTLQDACPHLDLVPIKWQGRKAHCQTCLKTVREYCPKSPTRFCWYNEDGKATDYHDKCKYCGTMMEYP